ncbi:MAG: hypothetical protein JXR60_07190 [Bacteroidales bacterium]|nr:hypothetical protein [Bacteroidales bacterium]
MIFRQLVVLIFFIVFLLVSCVKDEVNNSLEAVVTFSTDTLFFDTVFTDVGSTTAYITMHNPYDKSLNINSVSLGKGSLSQFRINVDGQTGEIIRNLTLEPKDSIYILVELTVKPNAQNAPFVVEDSLVCNVNGKISDMKLRAWGQNAHYIDGRLNGVVQTQTWTADKPYLIYNSMLIDSLHTLTIEHGTKIYFHKNSYLIAKGRLQINGTFDNPVTIKGDRLEEAYQDVAGQWGNIILADGSGTHEVNWAVVENGTIGFQLGGLSSDEKPTLKISHSIIRHMNYAGIFSLAANVEANNCLVANCAFYNLAILVGGNYSFDQCTFANYWPYSRRTEPSVVVSNNFITEEGQYVGDLHQANFNNCIIYGDKEQEFIWSKEDGTAFNLTVNNSLIRIPEEEINDTYFNMCRYSKDPLFIDYRNYDFNLDTLSPAQNIGDMSIGQTYPTDLNNHSHILDGQPDAGAFEWQLGE